MPFHRFEKLKSYHFNPHLSSTTGPIIEGDYMFFRRVKKLAGGKSRLPELQDRFSSLGQEVLAGWSDQLTEYMRRDRARFAALIKDIGLSAD